MRPIPRPTRILVFVGCAAVSLVALAWVATVAAPAAAAPDLPVAQGSNLEVDAGAANALVFPFQLAPASQSDEDGALAVSSASLSATVVVPACQALVTGNCPGVIVEVLTSDQVAGFTAQPNETPLWCTNVSGAGCAASTGGTFGIDLTAYAGLPLDLIVWSPAGVEWANLDAHGTWSS